MHSTFSRESRRRIFVGDVHGCFDELLLLMDVVGFQAGLDQVVSVGDMFRKGPKSGEVMRWVRANGVVAVRGNHEERLLRQRRKFLAGDMKLDNNPDVPLMTEWTDDDWRWLEGLPYSIDFPRDNILVVHAGLVAGKALEGHSPVELTEMRSVVDGLGSKQFRGPAELWARHWTGPRHVVFGHDAARGLQREAHATGLDTGAVYGRHLSCLVVTSGEPSRVSQVPSLREYCEPVAASKPD